VNDDRVQRLVAARRTLLALPPLERVEHIVSAPRPAALVRALPAQDFYLTLTETGVDLALPVLQHATTPQVEFLFDIDAWQRDEIDPGRFAAWLELLHQADPELVARWLREADEPTVVLALSRLIRVYKLDESSDQDFWPPDRPVPSLDGLYYLEPLEPTGQGAFGALWEGLTLLRERDRPAYEALLEQVLWVVPAEQEEEAYARRVSRLAERGFPELSEAIEAWAAGPETDPAVRRGVADRFGARAARPRPVEPPAGTLPALAGLDDHPGLAGAVRRLDPEQRERWEQAFVRLGNRFAVASLERLGDPATHRSGLATALGFANIALEETGAGAAALEQLTPWEVLRLGVGAVQQRALRARQLVETGWLARVHLARERLDGDLAAVLEALLAPRPLYASADGPRPFAALEELRLVDDALATIDACGRLLEERLGAGGDELPELRHLPAGRTAADDIEWSAVCLTALARRALGEPLRPRPLSPTEARSALQVLLSDRPPRTVTPAFEERAAGAALAPAAGWLAERLTGELADLPADQPPDPRVVRSLLLRA
jgi:hypothetical protein